MKQVIVLATDTENLAIKQAIQQYSEQTGIRKAVLDHIITDCIEGKIKIKKLVRPRTESLYSQKTYLLRESTVAKLDWFAQQLQRSRNYVILTFFVENPHHRKRAGGTIEDRIIEYRDLSVDHLAAKFGLKEKTVAFILETYGKQEVKQPRYEVQYVNLDDEIINLDEYEDIGDYDSIGYIKKKLDTDRTYDTTEILTTDQQQKERVKKIKKRKKDDTKGIGLFPRKQKKPKY